MRDSILSTLQGQGLFFTIVGPPGVGKNALMEEALAHQPGLRQLATATTRPRRPNEQAGRERLFVSVEEFQQMIARGDLLEWQEVHPGMLYGVPRRMVEETLASGQHLIADIDVLGATYIRSLYPQNVVLIFVQPPSVEALEDRMHTRGEAEADIQMRLTRVAMEMAYLPLADHVVVNDDFAQASASFQAIIADEIRQQHKKPAFGKRYSHSVAVIPLFENQVLCAPSQPAYPVSPLLEAEIPHEAALRTLEDVLPFSASADHLLRIKPNKGSFVSPVQVDVTVEGPTKHILFTYVYLLPERVATPPGWSWQAVEQADLPEAASLLLSQEYLSPNR